MNKSTLIENLFAKFPELTHHDISDAVDAILGLMIETVEQGGRVELRGFGAFSRRTRVARTGRNPKTGEVVTIPAKYRWYFKPSRLLHAELNQVSDEA